MQESTSQSNGQQLSDVEKVITEGDINRIEQLIEAGLDINQPLENGNTLIYIASYNGHLNVLKHLIKSGADFKTPLQGLGLKIVQRNLISQPR